MNAVEKIKAEYAEKLRAAETEDAIAKAVDSLSLPQPRMIHVRGLYGAVASLHYGDSFSSYGKEPLAWETVLALAEKLPGVPLTQVRDGCLSFRAAAYCDSLPEADKERWESETPACPLLVKIGMTHGYSATAELEWIANLPGVGLVEVSCNFPSVPPSVARYHAKRSDYRGGFRYDRPEVKPAEKLDRIEATTPADTIEHIAELQRPIVWSAGSPQSPSPVTLFWVDIHSDQLTTTADIVRQMMP